MTECARRESKECRAWSVSPRARLASFDSPRRLRMIPLQPKLYYILLNFIKLYTAPSGIRAPRHSIFNNVLQESDSLSFSVSTNVWLRSRFRSSSIFTKVSPGSGVRRFSIFTNVSPGSGVSDSQSLPIFSRFTNRKTQLLSLFQAVPAPMTGAAASQYLLRTL